MLRRAFMVKARHRRSISDRKISLWSRRKILNTKAVFIGPSISLFQPVPRTEIWCAQLPFLLMGLKDDFIRECKRANWHFDLIKASSLNPLIAELDKTPRNMAKIATTFQAIDAEKRAKYKNALDWLIQRIGLQSALNAQATTLGVTAPGYAPGKTTQEKDHDGGTHTFERQQMGQSCGPTCVRIVLKAYTHITLPSEVQLRDELSLHEHGVANTGATHARHDWQNVGGLIEPIKKVLVSKGVKDARIVSGPSTKDELRKASKNRPAIIGWYWNSGGGHWTVCVGPTKNGQEFIILDPWYGVQHVKSYTFYQYDVGGISGTFDPNDASDPAVIVTHPKV